MLAKHSRGVLPPRMSVPPMSEAQPSTKRTRRIEEAILELDGVTSVRVWSLSTGFEIGVRVAPIDTPSDVLKRVRELTDALREGDELWDVGLLAESDS